jgi:hypothetical protein
MEACFPFGDHLVEYLGSLIKQFPIELFAVALPLTRGARSIRLHSMNDSTDEKFEEVEGAVKQAVLNFANEIENIFEKFDPVAPSTIVEFQAPGAVRGIVQASRSSARNGWGWETTLTGLPKEIYQLWAKYFRERGYKLRGRDRGFSNRDAGRRGHDL